ncbi:C1 family peptidase [Allorhodopirellula heiligendammensis]|nr:C1 family peptidase [Allorhodopirellula heiligendammensis]
MLTLACLSVFPTGMVFGQGVQLTPPDQYQSIPTHGVSVARDSVPVDHHLPRSTMDLDGRVESSVEGRIDFSLAPSMRSLAPGMDPQWGTDADITLPRRFDLTDYLPTPGKQTQNDCVAWTIAYAAYSCQIAQERRRKPTEPSDQFSPGFIFDQLSESGRSLHMLQAIQFVKQNGCATFATMPLAHTRVSQVARIEAKNYRMQRNERAASLEEIKTYIYEGYPVVLIVRMGGDFRSDAVLEAPYRWRGESDPRPDYHAITAVGFDETRKSLLIMNSWGTQWKDNGFCWASYSNFERIDSQSWCVESHVIGVKRFAPLNVSMSAGGNRRPGFGAPSGFQRRTFQLASNRQIYEADTVISPDHWVFDDIACNHRNLFALGRDQTVYRMNDEPAGRPSWTHLNHGSMSNKKVAMMVGDRTSDLWVLTTDHELFRYEDGDWVPVVLSSSQTEPVDLRSVGTEIHATTADGRVFTQRGSGHWSLID